MSTSIASAADLSALRRAAVLNGVINAVINMAIQALLLRGKGPIPLTADAISSTDHTVLSGAVPLAVSLAMILTAIGWMTTKGTKRRFFPHIVMLILKHGFLAFGVVVSGAVIWQRLAGTVSVSVPVAVVVLGLIAGLVAAAVHYFTAYANSETQT
jgi:hypothetical protein